MPTQTKQRTKRPRTPRIAVPDEGAKIERDTAGPFVNVVVLDNSVPGGWRYEQKPVGARNGTH